jgi:hypothetical protein
MALRTKPYMYNRINPRTSLLDHKWSIFKKHIIRLILKCAVKTIGPVAAILLIEQNYFNPASGNLEFLTIWHLKRVVPGQKFCFLPEASFITETGRSQEPVQKRLWTLSLHQLLWYLLTPSPTPSTSSAMKTPENTEEDPNDTEPIVEGHIQVEYSSD